MTWLVGNRTYILAGLATVASVLGATEGWITTYQGVTGIVLAGIFAALRAAIGQLQADIGKINGGAK